MDIHKLLKMNSAERLAQTQLAAAALLEHQHRYDAKEYIAEMLRELRDVAQKAGLRSVVRHIDAARRDLHDLPASPLIRKKI